LKKFYWLFFALSVTISAYATTKVVKHTIKKGETLYTIAQKYHTSIDEIKKRNKITSEHILQLGEILTVPTNTYFSGLVGHEIEEGDSIESIAKKYNSTVGDILLANGISADEELEEGDTLKVPENTYFPTQRVVAIKKVETKVETKIAKKEEPKKEEPKKEVSKKVEAKKAEVKKETPKKTVVVKKDKPKETKKETPKVAKKEPIKTKEIKVVKYKTYKIRRGDTISTVAKRHNKSTKELLVANNLKKGVIIKLGKTLKIPYTVTKTVVINDSVKSVRKKSNEFKKYIIKKGDTLFTIARKHHTTTKEIREANNLKKGEILQLGRELKVPINTYFSGLAGYLIQSGDTLFTIARAHKTTIAEVREANDLEKGAVLAVGQLLKVPQNTYNPNQPNETSQRVVTPTVVVKKEKKKSIKLVEYEIVSGDTLSTISRDYSVEMDRLRELNNLKKGAILRIGEELKLPYSRTIARKVKLAKIKRDRQSSQNRIVVASNSSNSNEREVKVSQRNKRKSKKYNLGDIFFSHLNKSSSKSNKIISLAKKKLGRKYVWGATGKRNTFDCSGLTTYVYKQNGINLPRRAIAQSKVGKKISRSNLKKGDLIFFDTSHRKRGYVNHVGIYIGNNKFIHASSAKKKVVITSLNKPFYSQRFRGGRRL